MTHVPPLNSVHDTQVEVLSTLSHRNIVQFYGAVTEEPNFSIVTGTVIAMSYTTFCDKCIIPFPCHRNIVTCSFVLYAVAYYFVLYFISSGRRQVFKTSCCKLCEQHLSLTIIICLQTITHSLP